MPCVITHKGVQYTEPEFFAFLADGELDNLISQGIIDLAPKPKPETFQATLARFEQETVKDHIADFFGGGGKVRTSSFANFGDMNAIKGSIAGVVYMRKEGLPIDVLAADIARMPEFEGRDEHEIVEEIVSFIRDNPEGVRQYVKDRVQEQSQTLEEQADEYYSHMYGGLTPEMLDGLTEQQQDELLKESEQFDNWLSSISPEETDRIYSEYEAATNPEFIDSIINQSNEHTAKEGSTEKSDAGTKRTKKEKPKPEGSQEPVANARLQKEAMMQPWTTFKVKHPDISQQEYFDLRSRLTRDQVKVREQLKEKEKAVMDVLKPVDVKTEKQESIPEIQQSAVPVKGAFKNLFKGMNFLQDKWGKLVDSGENWLSGKVQQWATEQNTIKRSVAQSLTSWYNGLPRSSQDLTEKMNMKGSIKLAQHHMAKMIDQLRMLIDNNLESLERVHEAMDPDFYAEGNPDYKPITRDDLNGSEQSLYDTLRMVNDYVHDYNYGMGFIDDATYNKFKWKYIPRMYEPFEVPEDVQKAIEEGNHELKSKTSKLTLDFFKARKEIDKFKRDNILKDPIYSTAKRMMQTEVNAAIKGYIDYLVDKKPDLISTKPKDGFTQLSGKGYGALDGSYVANFIAEDFKGYFFGNELFNAVYDVTKLYDRNTLRQFFKKYHTVFSPVVQLGNATSNFVFAFSNGIDPVTFASNISTAVKELKNEGEVYELLLKRGILGTGIISSDLVPLVKSTKSAFEDANKSVTKKVVGALGKLDKAASDLYGATDDVAKVSAYLSLREYGYSEEEAIKRVYEGFQNYATVGKIWDMASKTPFIGNAFVKFQADLQRILKNAALKRPLTTAMYLGVIYAVAEMLSNMSGESDEDKELREARKYIPKIRLGLMDIPLVFMTPAGEVNLARYLSPYYIYDTGESESAVEDYSKLLPYQIQNINREEKGVSSLAPALSDPLLGVWWAALAADVDFRGKSIQNPEATKYRGTGISDAKRTQNAALYIARSQVPAFRLVNDLYLANRYGTDFYDRPKEPWQVLASTFVKIQGFPRNEYELIIDKEVKNNQYEMKGLQDQYREIRRAYEKDVEKYDKLLENKQINNVQHKNRTTSVFEKMTENQAANMEKQAAVQKKMNDFTSRYRKYFPAPVQTEQEDVESEPVEAEAVESEPVE